MSEPQEVTYRGQRYPVLDRVRVNRNEYFITARLGRAGRERFQVFDRSAGPEGELRMLHRLPRSRHTTQKIKVLSRVARDNRNAPQILQYQVRGELVDVVTTWLPGQDLAAYLDDVRAGRIPWPSAYLAFKLVRGLAHGLCQLQDRADLVHGDIKPANLIVAARSASLSLIDFGSAWLEERTIGRAAGDGTTNGYAAPELRTSGGVADWRSDQFSVSVVLYELLTGTLPYDGLGGIAGWTENREEFASAFVAPHRAPRERAELPVDAWRRIDTLVTRGLQLGPSARFPTTGAWRESFDTINAVLHAPRELGPWNRRIVRGVEWVLARFRRHNGHG